MGRERHLQLHFDDPRLEGLTADYGLDGAVVEQGGDYLLVADTSVRSTKLNLILRNTLEVDILVEGGGTENTVKYTTTNPFPEWKSGRDPRVVRALMLDGVYGSYLRLYAPTHTRLTDLRVDGESAGAQHIELELGRRVFGRYLEVPPGQTKTVEFAYRSEGVVESLDDGWKRYRLYIQKQSGTDAVPLRISVHLPVGSDVRSAKIDGVDTGLVIDTDMLVDREVDVIFRPPD
jgi:hypothetical protein